MERSFLYIAGTLAQGAAAAQVSFAGTFRDLKNGGRGKLAELAAVIVVGIATQLGIEEFRETGALDATVEKKNVARALLEGRRKHGKEGSAGALGFEFEEHAVHKSGAEFFAADVADISFPAKEFEDGSLFEKTGDTDTIADAIAPQATSCRQENGIFAAQFQFVKKPGSSGIPFKKFQEMRCDGGDGALRGTDWDGDDTFGGEQTFSLNRIFGKRFLDGGNGEPGRSIGPATDHAKIGPKLSRGNGPVAQQNSAEERRSDGISTKISIQRL